jgi:hypothetical protein
MFIELDVYGLYLKDKNAFLALAYKRLRVTTEVYLNYFHIITKVLFRFVKLYAN